MEPFSVNLRREYIEFANDLCIEHSWQGLLTRWNHRIHKDTIYTTIYNQRRVIEVYKGRENVMRVARLFTPTRDDVEAVDTIIEESMTAPFCQPFNSYLLDYALPKCLHILKLWVLDLRDGTMSLLDKYEVVHMQKQRRSIVIHHCHYFDYANTFPRLNNNQPPGVNGHSHHPFDDEDMNQQK